MPRGDRTGPQGMGPMTGRGAGFCAGYPVPGFMNPGWGRGYGYGFGQGYGYGRGYGFGWGRGRGWRHRHWQFGAGYPAWSQGWTGWNEQQLPPPGPAFAPAAQEQELEGLRQQASYFEQALDDLKKRIRELESSSKKTQ
jgi:hypothetical protein